MGLALNPRGAIPEAEREVNEAAGSWNADFGDPDPPRIKESDEGFDHWSLEPVLDARARCGEVANPQIRTEAYADRHERVEAWVDYATLDSGQVTLVHASCGGEARLRDAGLDSQLVNLLGDVESEPSLPMREFASTDRTARNRHAPESTFRALSAAYPRERRDSPLG